MPDCLDAFIEHTLCAPTSNKVRARRLITCPVNLLPATSINVGLRKAAHGVPTSFRQYELTVKLRQRVVVTTRKHAASNRWRVQKIHAAEHDTAHVQTIVQLAELVAMTHHATEVFQPIQHVDVYAQLGKWNAMPEARLGKHLRQRQGLRV